MVRDLLQLNTIYKRFFMGAALTFVFLCVLYGAFLKTTVASVVERRSLEAARAELAARVSVLEAAYIREGSVITRQKASELGFVAVTPKSFVSRAPHAQAFSLQYGDASR